MGRSYCVKGQNCLIRKKGGVIIIANIIGVIVAIFFVYLGVRANRKGKKFNIEASKKTTEDFNNEQDIEIEKTRSRVRPNGR